MWFFSVKMNSRIEKPGIFIKENKVPITMYSMKIQDIRNTSKNSFNQIKRYHIKCPKSKDANKKHDMISYFVEFEH